MKMCRGSQGVSAIAMGLLASVVCVAFGGAWAVEEQSASSMVASLSVGQKKAVAPTCTIRIESPMPGQVVSAGAGAVFVSGKIDRLPKDAGLWLFVRREDFAPKWWPQALAKIDRKDGSFHVVGTAGNNSDKGRRFNVVVAAVDKIQNDRLSQ